MAVIVDDRTPEEHASHSWLVIGTARGVHPCGGSAFVAWACKPDDRREVFDWAELRGDMVRIREASADGYRPGRGCDHLHIFPVRDYHPSVRRKYARAGGAA